MPKTSREIMSIHDDAAGQGAALAFPTMSSCSACICVLAGRMVGVHKTMGWENLHDKLFSYARSLIGTDRVYGLYVAGWNAGSDQHHDLRRIASRLGLTGMRQAPIRYFDYNNSTMRTRRGTREETYKPGTFNNKISDLCTFAFQQGTRAPNVGIKRTSKVDVHAIEKFSSKRSSDRRYLGFSVRESLMISYPERIETPSDHLHAVTFQSFS